MINCNLKSNHDPILTALNNESVTLSVDKKDATKVNHDNDWTAKDIINSHLPTDDYNDFLGFLGNSERTALTLQIFQEPRRINDWRMGWGSVNKKSPLSKTILTESQLEILKTSLSQSFRDVINIIEPLHREAKNLSITTDINLIKLDEINKDYYILESQKFAGDDLCFDQKFNEVKVNFLNKALTEIVNLRNKTNGLLKDRAHTADFDILKYRSDKIFHILITVCVTEALPDLKLRLNCLSTIDEVKDGWKEMQVVAKNATEQPNKVATVIEGAPVAFRGSNSSMSKHFSFGNINALKGIIQTEEPCGKKSSFNMESILDHSLEQNDNVQNVFLARAVKRLGPILFGINEISGKAESKTPVGHFEYIIKENFSQVSEYPVNQSIADTVALINELDDRDPNDFIRIYDPSMGWGNRAYSVLAINSINNGQRPILKITGNDPNSERIKILPYLERVSESLQFSENENQPNNELLQHIKIGKNTIGDTFKSCLAGNAETEEIGQTDIFRSSPPFADTMAFPGGRKTEYEKKFGLRGSKNSDRPQYEEYPGPEVMDADTFATEFVYKLVTLGAIKLRNGGKFSMAFNRNHAMVLSSYLVNSVYFDNVRLSAQTVYKGKGASNLHGPSHVYVIATRTPHEAPKLKLYNFKDDLQIAKSPDLLIARNPETYMGFIKNNKITLYYSKAGDEPKNETKVRKRKSEEI